MHKASVNVSQSIFFCRVGGKRVHKNNHMHFLMHFKPKPSCSSTDWKVPTPQIHKKCRSSKARQPKGTMYKDCGLTQQAAQPCTSPRCKQGENGECKSEKTQGWRLKEFHRESTSHHPLPPSAVCSPSPGKQGSLRLTVSWKTDVAIPNSPLPPFPSFYCWPWLLWCPPNSSQLLSGREDKQKTFGVCKPMQNK